MENMRDKLEIGKRALSNASGSKILQRHAMRLGARQDGTLGDRHRRRSRSCGVGEQGADAEDAVQKCEHSRDDKEVGAGSRENRTATSAAAAHARGRGDVMRLDRGGAPRGAT